MAQHKPAPLKTPTAEPFWAGLAEDRLMLPRCNSCGRFHFYPRNRCPFCLSASLEWREASGRGVVYTFSISRVPTAPQFADEVPQCFLLVELEEGPRIVTTPDCADMEAIEVGMPVVAVFDHHADPGGDTRLKFRPQI